MRRTVVAVVVVCCLCSAAAAQEKTAWVTMGEDVYDRLAQTTGVISSTFPLESFGSQAGVVITRLPERDLHALSEYIHRTTNRCGGFIIHDSLAEAEVALEAASSYGFAPLPSSFEIDQQTQVQQLLPLLDKANILSTIQHLSTQYNNRYYLNTSGQQSALWIRDLWQGYATGRSDITVTTYNHSGYIQPSVIMTINGATLPDEVIVVGGHLDSIQSGANNSDPATIAPGADDNASGIAAISEAVRVLLADGFVPDRTVKFMGYAAEEVGLRGSGDIAADHANAGTNVVGVMQFDMTDFNGSVEDIVFIDDNTNADLTSFVASLVDTYQPELQWTTTTCGYACSDHASWHNQGFPAVFPFEARFGDHNLSIHTVNDTLATLGNQTDHALKFSKVALSFVVETGLADCTPAAVADAGADRSISEGNSTTIGTPALAGHTYSWSPGGASTAEVLVSPTSTTTYTVTATTSCGSAQDSVTVTVNPAGSNGPQDAAYDAGRGAPACAVAGSSCDSTTLLDGRANLGPEPNQPNTLDSCSDGTQGSYHSDESNDRIVVSTLDGMDMVEGATVQVDVTVWAWNNGSDDTLDLYYAADADNPVWVPINSITPPGGGAQTLSAQYTLPDGTLQAIRANFRYQGSASPCSTGTYDDHDDLVFAVKPPSVCTVDADCDDGAFCNGAETCNAGSCESGTAVDCDDGVSCTNDSCNEGTDSCDNVADDANCDDGAFCNGTETCDAVNDCQAGTAPDCDDGVGCTDDSCNEGTDSCDNVANNANCDDGAFCNGAETCDAVNDCQAGSDPCGGSACDEANDICLECSVDADCNDGAFCNGTETCNAGSCQAGTPPACDDGLFCNGSETCNEGTDSCDAGTAPNCNDGVHCTDDACNEGTDSCDNVANNANCDDGAFCNGTETCDVVNDCQVGTAPCSGGQTCNETTDICEGGTNPTLWMSFRSNTAVPGVGTVTDEDIVSYDEVTGTWALEFDGSDVGLGSLEISGLAILPGGDLLLSFTAAGTVGGLSVDDSDIVRFTPTSLGSTTAGTFSLYFDGSDVALTSNGEDIDGIGLASDGRLIVSSTGGFSGSGASGADEDLFIFTGTVGSSTSGSFAQYFDGSDVGLGGNSALDVDAAALTAGGNLLFSIIGNGTVGGFAATDEDVIEFSGSFGTTTSGSFSMRQDLSALGIAANEDIGSLFLLE